MRKLAIGVMAALIALSGQAMAEATTTQVAAKATASRAIAAKGATNEQIGGLGLVPTLLIAAGIIALIVVVSDDDDKKTSP